MKAQKQVRRAKVTAATPVPTVDLKSEAPPVSEVTEVGYPPPEIVLREAMQEPNRRELVEYGEAIQLLRDKKRFTFREIAEWLNFKFNMETDHNAVYRQYTKGMPEGEAWAAGFEDQQDEKEA